MYLAIVIPTPILSAALGNDNLDKDHTAPLPDVAPVDLRGWRHSSSMHVPLDKSPSASKIPFLGYDGW
jgi:hypothetical protein